MSQLSLFEDTSVFSEVRTEGIKYTGSKLKLIPHILDCVSSLNGVSTILDGFSGTTRVSQAFAQRGYSVISNDVAEWSEIFGNCYLLSKREDEFYQGILNELNQLEGYSGWFSEHYGAQELNGVKRPFQLKNTEKLDAIRDRISTLGLNRTDESVVLTSLIRALDSVDSTIGHYVSYLSSWSPRSNNDLLLSLPKRVQGTGLHEVIKGDVFDVIDGRYFYLAYFDPPYGSNNEKMPPSRVRYAAYYHIWKTVINNDQPELFGRANRREDSRDTVACSIFEEFRKDDDDTFIALKALGSLIRKTNARYILLSYSSGGRATKEELASIINNEGKLLRIIELDYKKNVMGNMRWTDEWINSDKRNMEYLFLMEK